MTPSTPLQPPYERYACNELRREVYRRKLRVIKSGPYANATKNGYLELLRSSDATKSKSQESREGIPRVHEVTSVRPLSTTGQSHNSSVLHDPRDLLRTQFSRSVDQSSAELTKMRVPNRPTHAISPPPAPATRVIHTSPSFSDTPECCPSTDIGSSVNVALPPRRAELSSSQSKPVRIARWDFLHSRLETVVACIDGLRGQARALRSSLSQEDKMELDSLCEDMAFYVQLKKRIMLQLENCVEDV